MGHISSRFYREKTLWKALTPEDGLPPKFTKLSIVVILSAASRHFKTFLAVWSALFTGGGMCASDLDTGRSRVAGGEWRVESGEWRGRPVTRPSQSPLASAPNS